MCSKKVFCFWIVAHLFIQITFSASYDRLRAQSTESPETDKNVPEELSQKVIEIFETNCTLIGCHSGSDPRKKLKLTKDAYLATTVNQPSLQKPKLLRIKPGQSDNSYLVMKIRGDENITGERMPYKREPLNADQISVIVEWINQIRPETKAPEHEAFAIFPFNGWKVINIPTTRTVDEKRWYFLISHRFLPQVESGYDTFYGLNGTANIFLNFGYAFTNRFFVNMGRSNVNDNVELDLRYRLKDQYRDDKIPIAVGAQFSVNWISEKRQGKDRLRSEALKYSLQASIAHQIRDGLSVIVVPGILINPDSEIDSEDPMFTIGLGGKIRVFRSISIVAEWSPIVSGYTMTRTFDNYNRFDTWAVGTEVTVGGHVFHLIVTNSTGLTTDQYMRGDLDIRDGEMRFGFNIFRILQF